MVRRVQPIHKSFRLGSAAKAFLVASLFLLAVAALCAFGFLPWAILWLYLGASLLSFVVYALDKSAAKADRQRTPENTLHMLALVGGWPGALYAQERLRHKSSKKRFRLIYWATVLLNLAALGALVSGHGTWLVELVDP